ATSHRDYRRRHGSGGFLLREGVRHEARPAVRCRDHALGRRHEPCNNPYAERERGGPQGPASHRLPGRRHGNERIPRGGKRRHLPRPDPQHRRRPEVRAQVPRPERHPLRCRDAGARPQGMVHPRRVEPRLALRGRVAFTDMGIGGTLKTSIANRIVKGAACVGLAVSAGAAAQQGTYPTKPIRLIVASSPGGPNDVVARRVATPWGGARGRPIVTDNRAGAAGVIGTELGAKAAPDGHTLLLGFQGPLVIAPNLNASVPYETLRDFAPVSLA